MKQYIVDAQMLNTPKFEELIKQINPDSGATMYLCFQPSDTLTFQALNHILAVREMGLVVGTVMLSTKESFLFTLGTMIGGLPKDAECIVLLGDHYELPAFVKNMPNVRSFSKKHVSAEKAASRPRKKRTAPAEKKPADNNAS